MVVMLIVLVAPIALVAFSLVSISARWNEFLWPLMVTQSEANRPLTVGLSRVLRTSEVGALYGQIMSGVLIVIVPLMVLASFLSKVFVSSSRSRPSTDRPGRSSPAFRSPRDS